MTKPKTYAPDGTPEYHARRPHEPEARMDCAWPGCDEAGKHRAPAGRESLDKYVWFCKPHAREYNSGWDYFRGMSRDEILRFQERKATWERPTWRIGGNGVWPENLSDTFDLFPEHARNGAMNGNPAARPPWTREERQALATLGLDEMVSFEEIKSRYKKLVKRWHPDANGSDPTAGDRLKRINAAYACLKSGVQSRSVNEAAAS